ncbi:hypothetical protein Tco_0913041 [Tanacetum coccineum]
MSLSPSTPLHKQPSPPWQSYKLLLADEQRQKIEGLRSSPWRALELDSLDDDFELSHTGNTPLHCLSEVAQDIEDQDLVFL